MAITNFSNFATNAVPLSGDFIVGFRNGFPYENLMSVDSIYGYVQTKMAATSGSYVPIDTLGNATVSNQLNVVGAIVGGGSISTTNGSIQSQGSTNSIIMLDRNNSGRANTLYRANAVFSLFDNSPGAPNGGNLVAIASGGNVGIGTTTPVTKLNIVTTSQNSTDGVTIGSPNGTIRLHPSAGAGDYNGLVQAGDQTLVFTASAGAASGALSIVPWSSTTSGIRMLSSGRVGIGTATPNNTLTVVGTISATGVTSVSGVVFADGSSQISAAIGSPVQSWQNVTTSRARGTTYTNSTGRPIQVAIYGVQATSSSIAFFINDVQVSVGVNVSNIASSWLITNHIIPNNTTYRLGTGQQGIVWWELR